MTFYKLTRGTMDEPEVTIPRHIEFGFGLLHVGGVLVVDYRSAGLKPIELQRAVHSYAQACNKQFKTGKTIDKDRLIIKRIA